jgi:hypothetical protein
MKTILVRYQTTPEYADKNAECVRAVFAELKKQAPPHFRYATYRLADGTSFMHVATMEGDSPLSALPAFQHFQAQLKPNCVVPPTLSEIENVAWYAPLS